MAETIFDLPNIAIKGQLFYVPGSGIEGGVTAGSAQIMSPDPGGYSRLILEPALSVIEWQLPFASWIMSKINGEAVKLRLAPTPQVARAIDGGSEGVPWDTGLPWDMDLLWSSDAISTFASVSLKGSNIVQIDMTAYGQVFTVGHVFGHSNQTYLIDQISYDGDIATIVCKPPLRRTIAIGDTMYFRPYFVGQIINGGEIPTPYMSAEVGMIQIPRLILGERVIL